MQDVPREPKAQFWHDEITCYEKKFREWEDRSKKIVKRYADERNQKSKNNAQFNILWSNVQTLLPALYDSPPKPNIDRRFDEDEVGAMSAQVLERCADYFVDDDENFDDVMQQVVKDRLLPGRGQAWVRYVPHFTQGVQVEPKSDVQATDDVEAGSEEEPVEELEYEEVVTDYVHWRDFGHTWGRTWQEVRGVWRKVYMTRKELIKRFGKEIGSKIKLDAKDENGDKNAVGKKATIYEIWDKGAKKAIWFHKDSEDLLDELDDPLRLKDFFPCPKPLYATLSNDNLVPTPDYVQYQDQAQELDTLTARIKKITDALRVAGIYDSSAQGIERLLAENSQNKLLPVDNFAVMGEKGGLKGVVDWFPTEQIAQTLLVLYDVRERVKQDLYEITGISDIVRGATDAGETATAQRIKGQFATLRLDDQQKDVARFARDLVKIMTEIVAEHFSIETVKAVSGIKLADSQQQKEEVKQKLQLQAMEAQQQQQPPPPIPDEIEDMLEKPSWEEVYQLIANDVPRCYRIGIETDSTIKTDQEAEKQARLEFLGQAGAFIQQASQVPNPDLHPLLMDMLLFGVRGFKVDRDMEAQFEMVIDKMRKKQKQDENAPPQPNPEEIAAQQEGEMKQAEMQAKQGEAQMKAQSEGAKLQLETEKAKADAVLKEKELFLKEQELALKDKEIEMKARIEQQKIAADALKHMASGNADKEAGEHSKAKEEQSTKMMMDMIQSMNNGLGQLAEIQVQQTQAMTKPKTVMRDENGQIVGVQ